jgi:hypothetical protein
VILTTVALSGTPAPSGGTFGNQLDLTPVVNAAGEVAFAAGLTGGSASSGLFAGTPGALQAVSLTGGPAPGGGTYGGFNSATHFLTLNDAGQLGFADGASGTSASSGSYLASAGGVQVVAKIGSPSPASGNYNSIGLPLVNVAGQVAISAGVGPAVNRIGALFVGTPGSVQTVALTGTAAPAGGNYNGASIGGLDAAGNLAFSASLTGGSATSGLFYGSPGSVQTVALQGAPAPAGGNFSDFGAGSPSPLHVNGAGQLAFSASLTGGSATYGAYVGTPGALQTVALQGTPAPAGGNYGGFSGVTINVNKAGQVAIGATLTGGSATSGIFVGMPGALQTLALQGDPAPGGGTYQFVSFSAMNGAGEVAFLAGLNGTSATEGLYAGVPGSVFEIVRVGDVVAVNTGTGTSMRTVRNISLTGPLTSGGGNDGYGSPFADNGLLVYNLLFTDGSTGIFTSVVPVPEPASVLTMAAVAGLAAAWRWRRAGPPPLLPSRPG